MHAIVLVSAAVLLALWPVRIDAQSGRCEGDFNGDGQVTINELVKAVNNALNDCPPPGPRFIDNADGTVTDTTTGLLWEKKSDDRGIHDKDTTYTWSTRSPAQPDGTAFTSFLATLNLPPCFAGHCDWRLPSASELQSLTDHARWAPAIDAVFDTQCQPNCTVLTCSCTNLDRYWSTTSSAELPDYVWNVDANVGFVNLFDATLDFNARAVRGGS